MTSCGGCAVAMLLQFHSPVMDFVVLAAAVGLSGLLAVGGTRAILSVLLLLMMRSGPQPFPN